MVIDEEPTDIRVFGNYVDPSTKQLEGSLVPYLGKLMEGSQLSLRCYPLHGPFHRYLRRAGLEKSSGKFQHSPPSIISSPRSVRSLSSSS
jgi:hypothetical protein